MKGRLPMNDPSTPLLEPDVDAQDPVVEPAAFTRDLVEDRLQPPPYNERQTLAEHSLELESRIQRTFSENAPRVDWYKLSDSERATLWQNMRRVRADVHQLRLVLILTGRPPDERERDHPAAPDWDDNFLQWLCNNWGQHVHSEPDYYFLRALILYQFSRSNLVAIRGSRREKEYLRMALIQAQEANLALTAALRKSDDRVGNYWRYHMLTSKIHQAMARLLIEEIQDHERTLGTKASDQLYDEARESAVEALNSFHRGIQCYPSPPLRSQNQDSVKAEEWASMANVAQAYLRTTSDFQSRLTWTQHLITLVTGAIREDKARWVPSLETIAKAFNDFAYWIHSHPERPLMVFPDVTPMFKEMQFSALAGLIYARSTLDAAMQSDTCLPHHYCLIIECALMMALTCISRKLLDEYSQETAHWVRQLQNSFPFYDIDPWYLQTVRNIQAKENATEEIRQSREKARLDPK
ncbi:hypothetical protein CPC16_005177 [Podila verticillata]|nr:hypothetical protein BGZ52_003065 [Haplosporangium bisporale]KAF9390268.1 hypothetical protein CPC16_005177 [Podila verticillata]KAI9242450.1 MAG: hypothetical protein BYD32DRAFT_403077 [Podila humilis]